MSDNSVWMIRSSGRISGPFTTEQVPQLLRSREIQLRDEIAAPMARWLSLDRHPNFVDAIESFKRQIMSENTEVSMTPTNKTNVTQTLTDLADHDLTDEITMGAGGYTNTKEIVVDDVKEEKSLNSRDIYSAQYQLQGLKSNPVHEKKVKQTSNLIQGVTILIVALVAAGVFYWLQSRRPPVERMSEGDFRKNVVTEINLGNYNRALDLLKSRSAVEGFIEQYGIFYAPLLLQIDQQTLLARRAFDQILATDEKNSARALVGMGLSYMVDSQWDRSIDFFQRAVTTDSTLQVAQTNLAMVNLVIKPEIELERLVRGLGFSVDGEALIMSAQMALQLNDQKRNSNYLEPVYQRLDAYAERQFALRNEAKFLLALIKVRMDKKPLRGTEIMSLVDIDPQLSVDHRYNVFAYRGHLNWSRYTNQCLALVEDNPDEVERLLTEVMCHYMAKNFVQARSVAEKVLDKNPKHPLVQAWYGLTLRETAAQDQASVAFGRALEANRRENFKIPLLIQARFCEASGNSACAEEHWKSLLQIDYNNIAAISGLAKAQFTNGAREEGRRQLARGLSVSPDYKPLLSLKNQYDGGL